MIITPPILPASFDVPEQVQLIPDAELKMRLNRTLLCPEYKILRVAEDEEGLYSHWTYVNPSTCEQETATIGLTHAEFAAGNYDAQDILEAYAPVENLGHDFKQINTMPSVLPVLPVPSEPVYSDFPSMWIYLASR